MYGKFKIMVLSLVCIAGMTACDATIHEYPNPGNTHVIIEPHIDRNPPLYYKEVVYDKEWKRTVHNMEEKAALPYIPDEELAMRLFLDVYRGTVEENASKEGQQDFLVERRVLYLDKDALPPQDTVHIGVSGGNYYVLAWADYVHKDNPVSWHYYADTLTHVRTDIKTYPSDWHRRSTASGQESFAIDFNLGPEGYPVLLDKPDTLISSRIIPVQMARPSGRYRVIASDFADFAEDGGNLDGCTAKVIYKQYVSVGYNVASREPNLFISTYSFNTKLKQDVADEVGGMFLFGDYLFTSYDKEDIIMADFYFYDSEGQEINHCENIEIPLKRNHETVIRGRFLTNKTEKEGDITIDENFEGEYVVKFN